MIKNYVELLGPESYKKGNFFYELIENDKFSINSYNELIENLKYYKGIIENDSCIDKKLVKHLYHFVKLIVWTIRDFEEGKYNISGIENKEDLFDYYEELNGEIMLLFSCNNS